MGLEGVGVGVEFCVLSPQLCRGQIGPKGFQMGEICSNCAHLDKIGPKCAQTGAFFCKMCKNGANSHAKGPKLGQSGATKCPNRCHSGPKRVQMCPKGARLGSKWLIDCLFSRSGAFALHANAGKGAQY